MAKLFDISDWNEQPWWNTGGTRNKKVYQSPEDGDLYYFKESYKKEKKDYKYEFWSEIVASEVGIFLGFDILPYHIAVKSQNIGCISKSMIDPASEELVEVGKYLQAHDNTFDQEDRSNRHLYDFQLVFDAIFTFGLEKYIGNILDTILFDALIGNSDRHQENWALVNIHSRVSKSLSEMEGAFVKIEGKMDEVPPSLTKWLVKTFYMVKGKLRPEFRQVRLMLAKETRFAPIYDSGCSFGRELEDRRVEELLGNEESIQRYLDRGMAEIHWEGAKVSHFRLVENVLEYEEDMHTMMLESMERMLKKFNEIEITELINNIDQPLKDIRHPHSLPAMRKELMIKLLVLRRNRIEAVYRKYRK